MPSKNVIIFGTGAAGKNFILNNSDFNIVAASDNDSSKWGNDVYGIQIVNPQTIHSQQFDLIVITSTWATSIKKQLIEELNIPSEKIIVPPKANIKNAKKPFEHEDTRKLGHE